MCDESLNDLTEHFDIKSIYKEGFDEQKIRIERYILWKFSNHKNKYHLADESAVFAIGQAWEYNKAHSFSSYPQFQGFCRRTAINFVIDEIVGESDPAPEVLKALLSAIEEIHNDNPVERFGLILSSYYYDGLTGNEISRRIYGDTPSEDDLKKIRSVLNAGRQLLEGKGIDNAKLRRCRRWAKKNFLNTYLKDFSEIEPEEYSDDPEGIRKAIDVLDSKYPGKHYTKIIDLYYFENKKDHEIAKEIFGDRAANAEMQQINNSRRLALVFLRAYLFNIAVDERTAEIINEAIDSAECNKDGFSCEKLLSLYYYTISCMGDVFDRLEHFEQREHGIRNITRRFSECQAIFLAHLFNSGVDPRFWS